MTGPPIYCTGGCDVCRAYARELGVELVTAPSLRHELETATAEPADPYYPDPFLEDAYRRGIARARVRVRAVLDGWDVR